MVVGIPRQGSKSQTPEIGCPYKVLTKFMFHRLHRGADIGARLFLKLARLFLKLSRLLLKIARLLLKLVRLFLKPRNNSMQVQYALKSRAHTTQLHNAP